MKILILSQGDFKSGKGHINRSNLVYEYLKKKKIGVDYFSFNGSKKIKIYNRKNKNINKNEFVKKIKSANTIITDEVSCPKGLINLLKKKFICSISPNGKFNKYAKIIFSRTHPIGRYSKNTIISSSFNNFLPGSNLIKIKNYKNIISSKNKITIGISMGGYDKHNKTLKLLKILLNFKKFIKLIILFNKTDLKNYNKISDYLRANKFDYKLSAMKKNTWKIFSGSAFLYLSGGISAYESIFVGIPSINIINDPHKKKLTEYLTKFKLTNIYKITEKKKISNITELYFRNNNLLLNQKNKIDNFIAKINYDPYSKLLKLVKRYYKTIN